MSDTFCPLLFQHLATHPHGGVTHCCIADHRNAMSSSRDGNRYYNLNHDNVHDTMNSESFRKARLEVLDGKKPAACMRCYREEKQNIKSKRQIEIENYPDYTVGVARNATDDVGYMKDVQLDFVELRLGNVCNVACRTCNPASSSKWRNDYDQLQKATTFKLTSYDTMEGFRWPEREEFWDDLLQHCDNVKTFYINGGEPTLIKQHFKFLDRLAENGRTDIKLWYNINMTNMSQEIIDTWLQFDNVEIGMSIDDLGDRNGFIRHPTKWDTVLKNLEMLLPYNDRFKLGITQTVSWMNYPYLGEFYSWAQEKGLYVYHNFVNDPSFFSPNVLPIEYRQEINKRVSNIIPEHMHWGLKQYENSEQDITATQHAIEYTESLDKIRNQNWKEIFPEIFSAINK